MTRCFPKKVSHIFALPYLRRKQRRFVDPFFKINSKNVSFTIRRKKRCFGTPIFQKIFLPLLRRFHGTFGGLFLEKSFVFRYTEISMWFWTPSYEKISFSFLRRFGWCFGEVFFEKSFAFHYMEISKRFWNPLLQKILFVSTEKSNGFCRGVFQKKHKKRAFPQKL